MIAASANRPSHTDVFPINFNPTRTRDLKAPVGAFAGRMSLAHHDADGAAAGALVDQIMEYSAADMSNNASASGERLPQAASPRF
jgi:hypothetical protein